jgi:hypothetical protein
MKSVALSAEHYAACWKSEGSIRPHAEINALGKRYAETHDQDVLLELCQCFHGYLMKYLVMICRGHLPVVGVGRNPGNINKDTKPLLQYFLPKGAPINRMSLMKVVKHFHLAFKGMETEEVYDVLMEQLIATINGYDPTYKIKVRQVVEVLNRELPKRKQFRAADVQRYLDFDCSKHIRLLCRRGFLEVVPGTEEGEKPRIQRRNWPPPAGFFEGDGTVIGLAYYIQKWFKYALQDWIARHSREIEATRAGFVGESVSGRDNNALLGQVDRANGNYRTDNGELLEVELGMMKKASAP